jgi:ankyrin repeat protein
MLVAGPRCTGQHTAAAVGVLLAAGAAIDEVTAKTWTALHCAARNGHETVEQLLYTLDLAGQD